ncbi:MAG: leucine--tRNA ligase [Burkholderiaceae bacterium]
MNEKYEPAVVEATAQAHWEDSNAYKAVENDPRFPKGKFYVCSMLPYPSGKLHMGHVRNYTINDVMYRYMRMNGFNVLSPMGWDAFGLPAENAAIDQGVAPAKWTYQNIAEMKAQMRPLGFAFDWDREMTACDPRYYKWNQWMFLKMLEKGIAYRKTQVVNWDPIDQTVLANEQVIDGKGWRTGATVEKREIPGYYLAITQYAQELLDDIDSLGWPDRVKLMQQNWLGRSTGVRFAFRHDIRDTGGQLISDGKLYVFTTRVDTIMGATFVVVAPEHPFAEAAAASNPDVQEFVDACRHGAAPGDDISDDDKRGIPTGQVVQHPISGEPIPVWVGNYVLMAYGDGAVMAVPAHDERDFAFARKYQLPIEQVVAVNDEQFSTEQWFDWYVSKDGVCINSGPYDGLNFSEAVDRIASDLSTKDLGEKRVQWRLRDWGISRQRYWGTPIPIIHCDDCGPVPVPFEDLPVVLPEDLVPDGSGNPLSNYEPFLKCQCPTCKKPARRETDTMDTFVDSAWYYMRYCSPDNNDAMVDERNDYWMPMDQYIGGIEHAVLHLLYARFWTKVMRDMKLLSFDEPFTNLFTQGMLLNESYYRQEADGRTRWFYPSDVELSYDDKGKPTGATAVADGQPVSIGGVEKMSKSKNNVVLPADIISHHGADTARMFTMFAGPPDQSAAWSASGVEGGARFLRRLWAYAFKMSQSFADTKSAPAAAISDNDTRSLRREVHLILKQANYDYERLQYNTVVSAGMKMLNALESAQPDSDESLLGAAKEGFGILLRILYPVVPHVCHNLWESLAYGSVAENDKPMGEIIDAPWPQIDDAALEQSELTFVLQINGKVRGKITVSAELDKVAIEQAATASEAFERHGQGKTPRKIIVVPGKLVNIVV